MTTSRMAFRRQIIYLALVTIASPQSEQSMTNLMQQSPNIVSHPRKVQRDIHPFVDHHVDLDGIRSHFNDPS